MRKWVGWDHRPRQPRPTIPAAGGEDHELQTKTEEIASAIGAPEEVGMILKSLEHAAANVDHPIKKIPADPPFRSSYPYVP